MTNHKILLLNQSYQPLSAIGLKKYIKLEIKGKIETLHYSNVCIYSGKDAWQLPSVIRLSGPIFTKSFQAKYSKKGLHARDNYTCAYCGKRFKEKDLTVDHIVPRSKGGITSWMNCITACRKCNAYKADFTIEETKMYMRFKPFVPTSAILHDCANYRNNKDWVMYLNPEKFNTSNV